MYSVTERNTPFISLKHLKLSNLIMIGLRRDDNITYLLMELRQTIMVFKIRFLLGKVSAMFGFISGILAFRLIYLYFRLHLPAFYNNIHTQEMNVSTDTKQKRDH